MSAEDPFRAKFSKDCSIAGGPHYLKGQIPHSLWPIFFFLPWSQRVNFYLLSSGVIYSSCSACECKICFHQQTHKCVMSYLPQISCTKWTFIFGLYGLNQWKCVFNNERYLFPFQDKGIMWFIIGQKYAPEIVEIPSTSCLQTLSCSSQSIMNPWPSLPLSLIWEVLPTFSSSLRETELLFTSYLVSQGPIFDPF